MSQTIFSTIVAATTSGNQLASILNDFKAAVVSGFSGTARPAALEAGGYWIDTTDDASDIWVYKFYDGDQDITVFTINKATGKASVASADAVLELSKVSADSVGPILKFIKERIASAGQTLDGDTLGEVQFNGTRDDGTEVIQARIKSISSDDVDIANQGAYLVFEITTDNGSTLSEIMRLVDGKISIGGVATPSEKLHVKGNGFFENIADDAVGPKVKFKKKRIASSGQVVSGDVVGSLEFNSSDDAGAEIPVAAIDVTASQTHTSTAQGSKIVVKTKKIGEAAFTNQVEIGDSVTVKTNLTVEGNLSVSGTTTTINSTTLDVADSNITVNKGGTQTSANTNKAGIKVEMSDATHAQVGFDSSKASKFVVGPVGSESEIVTATHTQTLTNKTLTSPSIATPTISSPTITGTPVAPTAAVGTNTTQLATTEFVQSALLNPPTNVNVTSLDVNWSLGQVFFKDVSSSTTFTFSNLSDGRVITLAVRNTSGGVVSLAFPTVLKSIDLSLDIGVGKESIYTFVRSNGKTYAAGVVDLS